MGPLCQGTTWRLLIEHLTEPEITQIANSEIKNEADHEWSEDDRGCQGKYRRRFEGGAGDGKDLRQEYRGRNSRQQQSSRQEQQLPAERKQEDSGFEGFVD